jgi:hypothetical protein
MTSLFLSSVANSLRKRPEDRLLRPPFTELLFDVHIIAKTLALGKLP